MKKTIYFLLFFAFLKAYSQSDLLTNYVPVSPNAASLGRFGDFEVNKNLGKADVSIPIYTISSGKLQLPISISYNTTGIRLNELASWVGLGWTLTAGGAIIRNVRGAEDGTTPIKSLQDLTFNEDNYDYLFNVNIREADHIHDKFILNALGVNSSFKMVENSGVFKPVFDDKNTLHIEKKQNGFMVILNDGTELNFFDIEETTTRRILHGGYTTVESAYFLSTIISSDKKDTIRLTYKQLESTDLPVITTSSIKVTQGGHAYPEEGNSVDFGNPIIKAKYLERIDFKTGYIKFVSVEDREDTRDKKGKYRLDKIQVYQKNNIAGGRLIKQVEFKQSYYQRDNRYYAGLGTNTTALENSSISKSLKLDALAFRDIDGTDNDTYSYKFEYDQQKLPARGSLKQDYWGYINDNREKSLVGPTTFIMDGGNPITSPPVEIIVGLADRETNPAKMKSGILKKIIYPTGGYTVFEYEANERVTEDVVYEDILRSENLHVYGKGGDWCDDGIYEKTKTIEIPIGDKNFSVSIQPTYQEYGTFVRISGPGITREYRRPRPSGGMQYFDGMQDRETFKNAPGGTYTIHIKETGVGGLGASSCPIAAGSITWHEKSDEPKIVTTHEYFGGLRIKAIKNNDGVNPEPIIIKKYVYEKPNVINPSNSIIRPNQGSGYIKKTLEHGFRNLTAIVSSAPHFDNGIDLLPTIEYGKITEYKIDNLNKSNGKTISYYENIPMERVIQDTRVAYMHPLYDRSIFDQGSNDPQWNNANHKINAVVYAQDDIGYFKVTPYKHGSLQKEEVYKGDINTDNETFYKKVKEINYKYQLVDETESVLSHVYPIIDPPYMGWNTQDPDEYVFGEMVDANSLQFYYYLTKEYQGKKMLIETKETEFFDNQKEVITQTEFRYNDNYQLTQSITSDSKGDILEFNTIYPDDVLNRSSLGKSVLTYEEYNAISRLKSNDLHRISEPIQTEEYKNGVNLSIKRNIYKDWGEELILPFQILTSKLTANLEARIIYYKYDNYGNPMELSLVNGPHITYLWGYNGQYPVAKIENATYADVVATGVNLSVLESTGSTEAARVTELNKIRNHTTMNNAQVTTYTYSPLIGIRAITDPRGEKITYTYDTFSRLEFIRDETNKLLEEYKYHYKN